MHSPLARLIVLLTALVLAVPESYAKRVGGGRTTGRQSQVMRQGGAPAPRPQPRSLPPPSNQAPAQHAQPAPSTPIAPVPAPGPRAPVPAAPPPSQTLPRQASSPWGGWLGGALIGLGLGSLLSSGDRHPNAANRDDGMNGSGVQPGNGQVNAEQPAGSGFGSLLLLGILVLAVVFLVRRSRARARLRGDMYR